MANIHPTAFVDKQVELDEDVVVSAFAYIGPKVYIGKGTIIKPHAYIEENQKSGKTILSVPMP